MTSKVIHIISLVLKVISILLGLAGSPYVAMIPAKFMAVALFIFACSSALKDLLLIVGDYLDDGKLNKSYLGLLVALLCCMTLLSGCANDRFLGLTKDQWKVIGKDVGAEAEVDALQLGGSALGGYFAKNPVNIFTGK